MEVGLVGEDERACEEDAYGEDGAEEHLAGHVDVLCAVDEVGGALQHARADGLRADALERGWKVREGLAEKMRCHVTRKTGYLNSSVLYT